VNNAVPSECRAPDLPPEPLDGRSAPEPASLLGHANTPPHQGLSITPPRCCHSDQTRDVPEATRCLFSPGTQCWALGTPMLSQVVTRWCVLRLCRKPHGLMKEPGSRRCRIVGRQISCQSRRVCHGAVKRTPYGLRDLPGIGPELPARGGG